MTATIDFFARNFQTIEIRMEDGATENVCFPLVPEARCFNKSIQRDLFRNIDYNSNHTRLSSFVRCAPFIMMRLELEYSLSRITSRNRGLGVIVKYRELWKSLSFMFGFCQNMVLLLEFSIPANAFIYLTYAFRSWQYAMATLLFIVFLFQSVRLRLIMANEYCSAASLKNSVAKAAVRTAYLVSDKTFFYAFFYTTITVIGTYYPLLLCLMLLDFFYRFRSTRFLLELFNKPKWSLLNNLVLFIILLYIYSFIFFKNHDVSEACNTILQCVQIELWLSMGLLGSNFLSGKTYNLSPLANLTNTLYIIFVIIYRALFLGIIINQKRKYRREQQLRKSRVDDQCFICGRTKEAINKLYRSEKGFKKHVEL
ncbi:MAG: hypothetical protein JST59_00900 [Actinobacteria bacterium]|nr:hypothetical protein [Actinomycetota bacterium]